VSSPSERLAALGIVLPPVAAPLAAYVPARIDGAHVVVSGQLPFVDGVLVATGRVGADVDVERATELARHCAINAIAAAASVAGGVDALTGVLSVRVYVAGDDAFTDQHVVANGASLLFAEVFGAQGPGHVRAAVGVTRLPLDAPVEVEAVLTLR
jgi:enamine deaminase RidA (YjgF/YER057c/UK114 family)